MSLSRPTASSIARRVACTGGILVGLLGFAANPALAKDNPPLVDQATAAVNSVLAVCPGQTFSQPFAALGDLNYYTLVEGSEFAGSSEGWQLLGGAHITSTTHPDGSSGSALDLPSGSAAISPPVCVTLQYPTARVWTRTAEGNSNVVVSVVYANTKSATKPKPVGAIGEDTGSSSARWALSAPFDVRPELGGRAEETRQVRFIFASQGESSDTQIYGLYVDPRMR